MFIDDRLYPSGSRTDTRFWIEEGRSVEMTVIRGCREGKQLVVTAGMHGCEYVGILAARQLARTLKPDQVAGTVVILPLLNEEGFLQGQKQIMPEDGENLNRCFPGDAAAGPTRRFAAAIEKRLYPDTDFLLDLHGGDIHEKLTPLVFYPAEGKTAEAAETAAKRLSAAYRVASWASNGLYSRANALGIPALLLERGCRGQWSEEEVRETEEDVRSLMRHLGILDGEDREGLNQQEIGQAAYHEAEADGFWFPKRRAGEAVKQGEAVGELRRLDGSLIRKLTADADGAVLYHTVALGVKQGDPLTAVGFFLPKPGKNL